MCSKVTMNDVVRAVESMNRSGGSTVNDIVKFITYPLYTPKVKRALRSALRKGILDQQDGHFKLAKRLRNAQTRKKVRFTMNTKTPRTNLNCHSGPDTPSAGSMVGTIRRRSVRFLENFWNRWMQQLEQLR